MDGARGVLLSIAGGSDLGLFEINEAAGLVADAVHEDANIIFGAVIDESLTGRVKITVIATGFDRGGASRSPVANATQTPVDLSHYSLKGRTPDPVSVSMSARTAITRRPGIDLTQPMPIAVGGEDQVIEGFDEASPLDVPAFMRRQHEG